MQRILSISILPALLAGVCHALSRLAGRMSVFIGVQPLTGLRANARMRAAD